MPIAGAFENTPVRLKLGTFARKHAINSNLRTRPPGLLCSLSHHVRRKIVWEVGAWLFLRRWGSMLEMVVGG